MHRIVALVMAAAMAAAVSGCALVSRHTGPVEGGSQTTVGFLGFEAVDNGYPMLPFYKSFTQGK
jgi:uncharacterized protein YceK